MTNFHIIRAHHTCGHLGRKNKCKTTDAQQTLTICNLKDTEQEGDKVYLLMQQTSMD